ncbi:MAG: hypothetical protein FWH37_02405 [Candidatus Bathyarchaeota archaeon]|nr:hypothetical protein [Candidatus Termiticorpusculum sp.]
MNLKINSRTTTKHIALITIFSALYAILRYLPLGPMIGLAGTFSFSDALAPLIGIVLGPFAGGISVIIGTFTAAAISKPIVFFGLDFLPGFINCVAMGFLIKRKWIPIIVLYALLLGVFIVSPYSLLYVQIGSLTIPFTWLHIVAFIVFLSPLRSKAVNNIKKFNTNKTITNQQSQSNKNMTIGIISGIILGIILGIITGKILHLNTTNSIILGTITGTTLGIIWSITIKIAKKINIHNITWSIATLIFIGTMLQHLTGSLLTQLTLGVFAEGTNFADMWTAIFYVYPFERILMVLFTTCIGVPLIIAIKKSMLPFETPINEKEKP